MTSLIPSAPTATTSPFDAIRREDDRGGYWSARELQPLLGYSKWRDFANAVDRARITCGNSGIDVTSNFADARKVSARRGPVQEDYRLSRYACYLTALNGDPRKPEVAAAQTYFAVKTREAEVASTSSADPLDVLAAMVTELRANREAATLALTAANESKQEARVANARIDAIEGRHDYYAALGWAKIRGFAPTDDRTLNALGRIARTVGLASNVLPGKAPHAHYGEVNTWPVHVWDEAARRYGAAS